jgi:hypothetical protein
MVMARRADGRKPHTNLFKLLGSTAPSAGDDHVDVSGAELGDTDVNTWVHGLHAHGAILNLGTGPVPLREGVNSSWVSHSDPLSATYANFGF